MKKIWYWLVGVAGLVLAIVFRTRKVSNVKKPLTDWDKTLKTVTEDVKADELADEAREPVEMPKELTDTGAWRIE